MKQFFWTPFFILFFLAFVSQQCFSQDRIILSSGDTVKCSINRVTKKYLYYTQNFNGVSATGKILKSNIREWSYYIVKEEQQPFILPKALPEQKPAKNAEASTELPDYGRIRVSVNSGLACLLGKTDAAESSLQDQGVSVNDSKSYYDNLKLGYQSKASVYYHWRGDYWFGALYNGFYTSSEITTPMIMDEVNMYYGRLGERYFVNFAGASFYSASRYGKTKQIGLNSSFSMGPAFYRDEVEMFDEQVLIQGISLGTNVTLGVEYFIKPRCSINFETSLFSSHVKKITVKTLQSSQDVELDKENYENLSRLDLSLGLVFYW